MTKLLTNCGLIKYIKITKLFVIKSQSCDQDLIKEKVKIIDFQTMCFSIDYGFIYLRCHIRIESVREGFLNEQLDTELLVLFRNGVT